MFKTVLKTIVSDRMYRRLQRWRIRFFPSAAQRKQKKEQQTQLFKGIAFYGRFLKEGQLVFDVGANEGNRVEIFLKLGLRVVAVEPQANCVEILRERFGRSIVIVPKGAGAYSGIADFYPSELSVLSSFSPDWIDAVRGERFKGVEWGEPVTLELTRLDELAEIHGRPDFIKIDVEGYEPEVLKGMGTLRSMISFEYTVPEQTNSLENCISELNKGSNDWLFNYSIGESFQLATEHWITGDQFKEIISTEAFIRTGFGDIYAKMPADSKKKSVQ